MLLGIFTGSVQWASIISPAAVSILLGLHRNTGSPDTAPSIAMDTADGISPSQPAYMPSALSMARPRQPVEQTVSSRSKQRTVTALRSYFFIMRLSAPYTLKLLRISSLS